jgi:hypothetical protein
MIAKTFEIRDRMTFIPALAVKIPPGCEADHYLLARAGFGEYDRGVRVVLLKLVRNGSGCATSDPYSWPDHRTMACAHDYITEEFDALESGTVIDVEYILGETSEPKRSESESE